MATDQESAAPGHKRVAAVPWLGQVQSFAVRTVREQFRSRAALFWALGWPVLWYVLTTRLFIRGPDAGLGVAKTTVAVSVGLSGALTVALVGFAQTLSTDLTKSDTASCGRFRSHRQPI